MNASDYRKLSARERTNISGLISRGIVQLVDDAPTRQMLQVTGYGPELLPLGERFQQYGFTSVPFVGAEAVYLCPGGTRAHSIVVAVEDRRYRLTALAEGEVAIHDDQGQKVHLTRGGIVIDGKNLPITIENAPTVTLQNTPLVTMKAATKVRLETPLLEVTGDVKDNCDTQPRTIATMRQIYDTHTHNDPQGGVSSVPNQGM